MSLAPLRALGSTLVLLPTLAVVVLQGQSRQVDDAMLLKPADGDWIAHGRDQATALFRAKRAKKESGTPTGTVRKTRAGEKSPRREVLKSRGVNGGVDGTRTVWRGC